MSYRTHAAQLVAPDLAAAAAAARPTTCEAVLPANGVPQSGARRLIGSRPEQQNMLLWSLQTTLPTGFTPANRVSVGATLRGLGGWGAFGAFGDASPNDVMDQIIGELKRAIVENSVKVGFEPDNVAEFLLLGPTAALIPTSAVDAAVAKNLEMDGNHIKQLDGVLRTYVNNGQKASGTPYSLDDWKKQAKVVGDDIAYQGGAAWDSSLLTLAPSSVVMAADATAAQIKGALPWIGGAAALLAGGYLVVTLGLAGPLLRRVGGFFKKPSHAVAGLRMKKRKKALRRRKG